jgi:hypothetical protein
MRYCAQFVGQRAIAVRARHFCDHLSPYVHSYKAKTLVVMESRDPLWKLRLVFCKPISSSLGPNTMFPLSNPRAALIRFSAFTFILSSISVFAADYSDRKLTDLTYIGSHNSYKQALHPKLMVWLNRIEPKTAQALDYGHPPLATQLSLGLRLFELDIFYDPAGNLYQNPLGDAWLFRDESFSAQHSQALQMPGFKVLHAQDIDFRTHCITLAQCLSELTRFSIANPNHVPIVITFNLKSQTVDLPGFTEPLPFNQTAFIGLQRTIIDHLGLTRIFRPAELQGQWTSLAAAVENNGWPLIKALRGKFLLVLDESEETLRPYSALLAKPGHNIFFKTPPIGHPDAAILILNDPIKQSAEIEQAVTKGYLVRTRADANTLEARTNDATRRDAAFSSGAQLISSDYYRAEPRFKGYYEVRFESGGFVR